MFTLHECKSVKISANAYRNIIELKNVNANSLKWDHHHHHLMICLLKSRIAELS